MKWEQNDYDPSMIQTADAARTRIGRAPWEYAAQIVREHNAFEDLLEAAKEMLDAFAIDITYATDHERYAHDDLRAVIEKAREAKS